MENPADYQEVEKKKVICYYCGTIYDDSMEKCPLCGGTATSGVAEEPNVASDEPVEEKPAKPKKEKVPAPTGLVVAAVIFLLLSVLAVGYFIMDMIGYLPGAEDKVQRDYGIGAAQLKGEVPIESNEVCKQLLLDRPAIEFPMAGGTQTLTVSVDAACNEVTNCRSTDPLVATISLRAQTAVDNDAQMKSATFTVTAVGPGTADIIFTCGDQTAVCKITCAEAPTEPTKPSVTIEPELNFTSTVVLTEENSKLIVRVLNLPDGETAFFSSSDSDVITVTEQGVVSAIDEGTATVTVDVGGNVATLTVKVDFSRTAIGLDDTGFELDVGKYFRLFLLDENGYQITEDVTFEIEDETICELRDERIYGLKEGITQVIVTYEDMQYVCVVQVSGTEDNG